jgi:hypothetical protein
MSSMTVKDVLTSSGKYPDRELSDECTDEVKKNVQELCDRVNAFLKEIGYTGKIDLSSGFRTSSANDATKNAKGKSSHLEGKACDIIDNKDQSLAKLAESRVDLLEKHDLYMEHPSKTIGKYTNWLHLSTRPPKSGKRVFYP